MYHALVNYTCGPIFRTFFRLKVSGKENIPTGEALIFAANHKSYLDPVLVGCCLFPRRLNYMAKAELWEVPVLAPLITRSTPSLFTVADSTERRSSGRCRCCARAKIS